MRRPIPPRALAAGLALLLAACEHPIAVVTPHAEVSDVVLADARGTVLARTRDNRAWEGAPLVLCDGRSLDVRPTLLDFAGGTVDLAGRSDLSLRAETDGPPVVAWEPLGSAAGGGGRLHALAAGSTRVRFLVWHVSHADLATPPLDVVVISAGAPECAP